ncbi:MAG: amino acid permease [Aeriscardovia sp.]|nr:amino acid permease [Aeriscardovia sp.]
MAIAIVLDALGGIAVAAVVPQKELFLNAGIFQTLQLLMYHFSPALTWLLGITSLLIVFGVVAEIGSWIAGSSAGLQTASEYGVMPRCVRKTNKHGVPTNMIVAQTIVVMWDAILTFGSGNAGIVSFLVATTLTTLTYLVCYLLMYASYFRLIFTGKDLHRTYNVPGGIVGKTIAAVCGTITSIIAFVMSFTPSSALPSDETGMYLVLLAVCFVVSLIIPIVISAFHKDYVKGLDPSRIKQLQYEKDAVED